LLLAGGIFAIHLVHMNKEIDCESEDEFHQAKTQASSLNVSKKDNLVYLRTD
jgi:hypothetical protein